jgi:hypothetical protein
MGQLLHQDLQNTGFDVERARRRIDAASKFCDALTTGSLFVFSNIQTIERTCSKGHILLRLNCPDDFPACDSLRRMATGAAVSILRV